MTRLACNSGSERRTTICTRVSKRAFTPQGCMHYNSVMRSSQTHCCQQKSGNYKYAEKIKVLEMSCTTMQQRLFSPLPEVGQYCTKQKYLALLALSWHRAKALSDLFFSRASAPCIIAVPCYFIKEFQGGWFSPCLLMCDRGLLCFSHARRRLSLPCLKYSFPTHAGDI